MRGIYLNNEKEEEAVKVLGEAIGFGRIMQLCTSLWQKRLREKGYPESGAHITCPDPNKHISHKNLEVEAVNELVESSKKASEALQYLIIALGKQVCGDYEPLCKWNSQESVMRVEALENALSKFKDVL